jgi:hypothetical protein
MFTGSAVRVQAVQDLKLQEEQEIGRRSWKSGRQHPQIPAQARRREGREQEETPPPQKKTQKTPNPKNLASLLSLSVFVVLFYVSLLLYRCLKLFIYFNYNFISLLLVAGGFEPKSLSRTTHRTTNFESSKLYLLNYKISSHLLQLKYSFIV